MRRTVALLATVFALAGVAGCGGDGAEPGAPRGASAAAPKQATLMLDFIPNAVHTGIYVGTVNGWYRDAGVDLEVQVPGESTDAPKLLAAGRADFAILDIHDLGLAREQGLDLVGVAPIVQRPLASVLARGDGPVRRPRDLEGDQVGVTGLPSDEAVVDSEVAADGGDPGEVDRVTIGFNAVASLAADKVDAATGFWNAEGVALRQEGVPIRIFKVDEFGAPPYPELILTTSRKTLERDPELVDAVVRTTRRGYALTQERPGLALRDLVGSNRGLDPAEQKSQLDVLLPILQPRPFNSTVLREWAAWDLEHGLLEQPLDVEQAFRQVG